ncbi:hypothetical protein H072_10394 [Dactylellina haptotyla CBS 200.50]|uniref:SMP-30/Gluconolactonase/LRE-like region domain-containing protein n=1 Tax=Dactylellina haptotyla (strain CBS 200.50) TaxID=1284197 RepID=S8BAG8_DACHA|nr:hypothetical protein H072_10394 [Dactylellina haptotyla CBS 200.50]
MYSKLINIGVVALPLFALSVEGATFKVPFGQNKTALAAPSFRVAGVNLKAKIQVANAIYFQTNALDADNEVVACKIKSDGSISSHKKFKTGGKGGQAKKLDRVAADTSTADDGFGAPSTAATDALFSQHSLIVVDEYLFTVNAGSNSVTMFRIDRSDPCKLTQVGKVVTSHGDLPVSLAYSKKLKTLCVANSGDRSGVACYNVDGGKGLSCMDKEPLQRTGTTEKGANGAGTISDIFFTMDDKSLVVVTKGNKAANQTSTVDVYPTSSKSKTKVTTNGVRSEIKGAPTLYGTIQVNDRWFYATDGTFGLAKLQFDPSSRKVTLVDSDTEAIDFQSSTGWIAKSERTGSVYVSDLQMNRIVEFNVKDANRTADQSFLSGQPGNLDVAVGGDFLYTLSPSNPDLASNTSMIQIMYLREKGNMTDLGSYVFDADDHITSQAHGMGVYGGKTSGSIMDVVKQYLPQINSVVSEPPAVQSTSSSSSTSSTSSASSASSASPASSTSTEPAADSTPASEPTTSASVADASPSNDSADGYKKRYRL